MSGITGLGTTFNLPNYHGQLIALTPDDNPFLSAIGGINGGGGQATAKDFEWQGYDLRTPKQNVALEGAVAPTAQERVRTNFSNVVQIHHEKVAVSYTKQAASGQYDGSPNSGGMNTPNPVQNELDWQVETKLKEIARDVNWSFLNGLYAKPADNTAPRKTRGLLAAAATKIDKGTNVASGASSATDTITPVSAHSLANGDKVVFTSVGDTPLVVGTVYFVVGVSGTSTFKVSATSGGSAITLGTSSANLDYHSLGTADLSVDDHINPFVQAVFEAGGLTGGNAVFLVNATQKVAISKAYATAYGKADPLTRGEKIGGVVVDTIDTDFGTLGIMLDRMMPRDAIAVATLSECRPVFLNIPGKGVFFEEPLAKTGSSDEVQLYGEIGLDYGNAASHGVLRGLKA